MTRAPLRDVMMLLALGALWGTAFMFIKISVGDFPPFTLVFFRVTLTAAALLIYLRATGERLPADGATWRALAVMGALAAAFPFTLVAWGTLRLESGIVAIIMGLAPVMTVAFAHFVHADERLNGQKLVGAAAAFGGLVMLTGPQALAGLGFEVLSVLACATSTLFYAASTVYARTLRALSPLHIATGTYLLAALFTLPGSLAFEAPWTLTPSVQATMGVVALALVPTAAGTVLYFTLVKRTSATFASTVNYIIPLTGLVWGMVFLGERPGVEAFVALLLILMGVALIGRGQRAAARAALARLAEPPA
jgi:drug/metabolite transporter (DMT)-like permease